MPAPARSLEISTDAGLRTVDPAELRRLAAAGEVSPGTPLRSEGGQWKTAGDVKGLEFGDRPSVVVSEPAPARPAARGFSFEKRQPGALPNWLQQGAAAVGEAGARTFGWLFLVFGFLEYVSHRERFDDSFAPGATTNAVESLPHLGVAILGALLLAGANAARAARQVADLRVDVHTLGVAQALRADAEGDDDA